jgi:GNAT superfamily N-acetyltransferase
LRISQAQVLNPNHNPFFKNAQMAFFIAEKDGLPLGRVAAIDNQGYNDFHGENVGFFGYFESVDDAAVSGQLLERASGWLRDRGRTGLVGPVMPSTNYEVGLLVEGFEHLPTFMTTWNPRYYPDLLTRFGFQRVKELYGWHLGIDGIQDKLHKRFQALSERACRTQGLSFSLLDMKRFDEEISRCWRIYADAWHENWGYSPPSEEEFLFIGRELKPLMVKEGALTVAADGEMVGFAFFIPDYNRYLRYNRNGRLLPLGWWHLLRAKRKTPWVRNMLAGITPEYRKKGVLGLLLYEAIRRAPQFGVRDVEVSWVLEDNKDANQTLEKIGATLYKRWMMYGKDI